MRRLRQVWRSAGWPYQDTLEAELLAQGWLERRWDSEQRVTVHLTDSGIAAMVQWIQVNQQRLGEHDRLVADVAAHLQASGRVVWCGLPLRVGVPMPEGAMQWACAVPDVFSIRLTNRPEYLEPTAHEVKVRRTDLLSDLRKPSKAAAYREAAGQCWYAIRQGIAEPDEIPAEYGVLVADAQGRLVTARAAPRHRQTLPFSTWMALARAAPMQWWGG